MSLTGAVRNIDSLVPKMEGIALVMMGNMTDMSLSADNTMPWNIQMTTLKYEVYFSKVTFQHLQN
jgi:hypothetical protein